jgi:hypothetical protein
MHVADAKCIAKQCIADDFAWRRPKRASPRPMHPSPWSTRASLIGAAHRQKGAAASPKSAMHVADGDVHR